MKRIQTTHRTGTRSPRDNTVIVGNVRHRDSERVSASPYIQMKEDPRKQRIIGRFPDRREAFDRTEVMVQMVEV